MDPARAYFYVDRLFNPCNERSGTDTFALIFSSFLLGHTVVAAKFLSSVAVPRSLSDTKRRWMPPGFMEASVNARFKASTQSVKFHGRHIQSDRGSLSVLARRMRAKVPLFNPFLVPTFHKVTIPLQTHST
jgi:hypothetical protein